ncbi:MAG: hypothetical protein JJU02_15635 [Cryomorphaceae bacterium]|nr:hypothetical protein [Cryomorphaceae bacterium]
MIRFFVVSLCKKTPYTALLKVFESVTYFNKRLMFTPKAFGVESLVNEVFFSKTRRFGVFVKTLVISVLCGVGFSAKGQFKAGNFLVNGAGLIRSSNNVEELGSNGNSYTAFGERFDFYQRFEVGVFISKSWMIGLASDYSYSRSFTESWNYQSDYDQFYESNYLSRGVGVGLTTRRFFSVRKNLYFMLMGGAMFRENKGSTDNIRITKVPDMPDQINEQKLESRNNTYFLDIRPGVSYAVSSRFYVEAFFGVMSYRYTDFKKTYSSDFDVRNSQAFAIGFSTFDLRIGVSIVI